MASVQTGWARVILLADMDAFFASVEQVDNPQWRGRPLALTNGSLGTCIITCSYEARARGVRTGMHLDEARSLCPDLIRCSSRPHRYAQMSTQIMQALRRFTPEVEVFSVDEAFLDLTRCQRLWGSPAEIGTAIKQAIFESSGVTCSIGISGDRTTAKYAASQSKPDGLTIIPPWQARDALADVPLTELCGVNRGIATMLAQRQVQRCCDLQRMPVSELGKRYGNPGRRIWLMAQGRDPAPIVATVPRARSLGHSKVLPPNTRDEATLRVYLMHMAHKLGERLRANRLVAPRFLFGLRLYRGWLKATLKATLPSDDELVIYRLGASWMGREWHGQGIWQVHIIALEPRQANQPDLFQRKKPGRQRRHHLMDQVNGRFGPLTIASARLLNRSSAPDVISPAWKPEGHRRSL